MTSTDWQITPVFVGRLVTVSTNLYIQAAGDVSRAIQLADGMRLRLSMVDVPSMGRKALASSLYPDPLFAAAEMARAVLGATRGDKVDTVDRLVAAALAACVANGKPGAHMDVIQAVCIAGHLPHHPFGNPIYAHQHRPSPG